MDRKKLLKEKIINEINNNYNIILREYNKLKLLIENNEDLLEEARERYEILNEIFNERNNLNENNLNLLSQTASQFGESLKKDLLNLSQNLFENFNSQEFNFNSQNNNFQNNINNNNNNEIINEEINEEIKEIYEKINFPKREKMLSPFIKEFNKIIEEIKGNLF